MQTKRERLRREPAASPSRTSSDTASGLYEKIEESFLRQDFAQAEALSTRYLAAKSASQSDSRADRVTWLRGLSLSKLKRFAEARETLKTLERESASPEIKARAGVSVADSYYEEGRFIEAKERYEEASRRYPNDGEMPQVLKRLAECAERSGRPGLKNHYLDLAAKPRPAAFESTYYSVQVGSFANEQNAGALLSRLQSTHYDAYLEKDESIRRVRVRVGKLPSLNDARMLEERLRKDGYPTKICP